MSYFSNPILHNPQFQAKQNLLLDHLEPDRSTVKKTHFVEWFSGDALDTIWTFSDIAGTGSGAMTDSVDGGYTITTGGTDDNESSINLNNIRHYSQTASRIITVNTGIAASRFRTGFSENTDMSNSFALVDMDTDNTNYETATDDGTTESGTSTGEPVDTTKWKHELQLGSSNVQHYMNDLLKVTKTTNLPDATQQPFFAVKARSTGAKTGQIHYLEAYST